MSDRKKRAYLRGLLKRGVHIRFNRDHHGQVEGVVSSVTEARDHWNVSLSGVHYISRGWRTPKNRWSMDLDIPKTPRKIGSQSPKTIYFGKGEAYIFPDAI